MEALEALGAGDEGGPEDLVDVDRRKGQVVRDVGREEEERADGEDRGDADREGDSQSVSPRASGAVPLKSNGSGGLRSVADCGARRVAIGEQPEVGVRLSLVAEAGRAEIAQPLGHPTRDERIPPAEEGDDEEHAPSALATINAGMARKNRKSVFQRF